MRTTSLWATVGALALVLAAYGCDSGGGRNSGGGGGGGTEGEGEGAAEGEGEGAAEGEGEGVAEGEGEGGQEGEGEGGQEGEGEGDPPPCEGVALECGLCGTGFSQVVGGACGASRQCHPEVVGPEGYQECIREQCESENCVGLTYCGKRCREDADCEGAYDGPVGSTFSCHVGAQGQGACIPGSLQPCSTSLDCENAGEACVVEVSTDGQHLQGFCETKTKCGAEAGETCNLDPLVGDVVRCANRFCGGGGRCLEFCDSDDQCAYSGALECVDGIPLDDGFPDQFSLCLGKNCTTSGSCGEEGYVCNLGIDRNDAGEVVWDNRCAAFPDDPNVAAAGEVCNLNEDNPPVVACGEGMCRGWNLIDAPRCASLCETTDDCPDASFVCEEMEWCVDSDDVTGECTAYLNQKHCLLRPGSGAACTSNADCEADGEECTPTFEVVDNDIIAWARCLLPEEGAKAYQEACGAQDICRSQLCLNSTQACSMLCSASDQCADEEACGVIGFGGATAPEFAQAGCVPWRGSKVACPGTHNSCEGLEGADEGEFCLANPVVTTGAVEFLCGVTDGEGDIGEECTGGGQCQSGFCWPAGEVGYCSGGCETDDDCADGMACLDTELADAAGEWPAAVAKLCRPARECAACSETSPCADGFTCSFYDVGDQDNPDRLGVCLLECENNADCDNTEIEVRVTCTEAVDEDDEIIDGPRVCAPRNAEGCGY